MFKKTLIKTAFALPFLFTVISACSQPKTLQQNPVYQSRLATADGTGKIYFGREIATVMGAAGADWLERNNRQQEENTALAISKMPLTANSVVADIGAGTGYYTFRIAKKVPQGKVYAVEVQQEFINYLNQKKKELGQQNVQVIKGSQTSPNLPDASIDLAIMVDVYHELLYPHEVLQALYKALKPRGKLLLLEFRAEDPAIEIKELHKMSVSQANKELAANGFKPDQRSEFLPIQHFLLYRKAD
ncbi:class I SAM-dependent methyltransferase [Mucilaginibacter arboris]|uniref:Methyltransferase domain-containing protein n=1 Tax=Mucilaginibacter arboris TaxID=2682090 RepID=A0A7K1SZ61_9SPHI|nr:class I SAM-dependent methyltransferase [Mucilaginibacter arboris]MVN22547.1 methyltransferase domain-containing protein [Mucilaginibacter arboris]